MSSSPSGFPRKNWPLIGRPESLANQVACSYDGETIELMS